MKPSTQALLWTIPIWTIIILFGMVMIMGEALDPFVHADNTILIGIAYLTSPLWITWLIGIATIYISAYIKRET